MSWNDGGKRDWDAFIATDESVDSELTDGGTGGWWEWWHWRPRIAWVHRR